MPASLSSSGSGRPYMRMSCPTVPSHRGEGSCDCCHVAGGCDGVRIVAAVGPGAHDDDEPVPIDDPPDHHQPPTATMPPTPPPSPTTSPAAPKPATTLPPTESGGLQAVVNGFVAGR